MRAGSHSFPGCKAKYSRCGAVRIRRDARKQTSVYGALLVHRPRRFRVVTATVPHILHRNSRKNTGIETRIESLSRNTGSVSNSIEGACKPKSAVLYRPISGTAQTLGPMPSAASSRGLATAGRKELVRPSLRSPRPRLPGGNYKTYVRCSGLIACRLFRSAD